ncbi:hypothetical protein GQ457_06G012400 [Hibiscus cannabinus]
MLAAVVPRPWLAVFAGVVFAQHLLGWYAQAASIPRLHASGCLGWRGIACSLVGPWLRASFHGLNEASFTVALPYHGWFGKFAGPFSDARHAQALSLHRFVAGNSAMHLPSTEVFLYIVQPLCPQFAGLIHTSAVLCSLCRRVLCDQCRRVVCVAMRKGHSAFGLVPYLRCATMSLAVLSRNGARFVHTPVCLASPCPGWPEGLSALGFAPCSHRTTLPQATPSRHGAWFAHIPVCLAKPCLAWPEGLIAFGPAPCSQYAPLSQAEPSRYGACLTSPCLDRPDPWTCISGLANKLSWRVRQLPWAFSRGPFPCASRLQPIQGFLLLVNLTFSPFLYLYRSRRFQSWYYYVLHYTFPCSCVLFSSPSFSIIADALLAQLRDLYFTAEEQDVVVVASTSWRFPLRTFPAPLSARSYPKAMLMAIGLFTCSTLFGRMTNCSRLLRLIPTSFLLLLLPPANRDNVLKCGPWEFLKYWFALECTDPTRTIHDYSFDLMQIWVHIHNIPLSLMTAELVRSLGACIGLVVMTDTQLEDGNMGAFMRVRVVLDATKPLRRCLRRFRDKSVIYSLQYECISLFCHGCGLLGHLVLNCSTTPKVEGQKYQYGAWLHAPQPKRPTVAHPRGRITVIEDDDSALISLAVSDSNDASETVPVEPAATSVAPTHARKAPPIPKTTSVSSGAPLGEQEPYDPMVHTDTSDMLEDSLDLSGFDGVIPPAGEDLTNVAIDEAADTLIREVASSSLVSSLVLSPPTPLLAQLSQLLLQWLPLMPRLCPGSCRLTGTGRLHLSIGPCPPPPLRANKHASSYSDPTKAKCTRASSNASRIPLVPKAGMSSVNNSSAETARHDEPEGQTPSLQVEAIIRELKKSFREELEPIHDRLERLEGSQTNNPEEDHAENGSDQTPNQRQNPRQGHVQQVDDNLTNIKIAIPSFQGRTDPDAYLAWESKVEHVFECYNYSEQKKVRLAAMEFIDYALLWWDQLLISRRRTGKGPVREWAEMKRIMRRRFVPSHYHRDLFQRLQGLKQGSRSVEEMEMSMMRANIVEDREATMARFLSGLNTDIANVVELQHYVELDEMVHMAIKVERQQRRKTTSSLGNTSFKPVSSTPFNSSNNFRKPAPQAPLQIRERTETSKPKPPVVDVGCGKQSMHPTPQERSRDIQCFKCLGRGHVVNQCPNRRTMLLRDNGDIESESEEDEPIHLVEDTEDDDLEEPETGKIMELMVVKRSLNAQPEFAYNNPRSVTIEETPFRQVTWYQIRLKASIAAWKASKEKITCENEESNTKVISASTSSSISSPNLQVESRAPSADSKVANVGISMIFTCLIEIQQPTLPRIYNVRRALSVYMLCIIRKGTRMRTCLALSDFVFLVGSVVPNGWHLRQNRRVRKFPAKRKSKLFPFVVIVDLGTNRIKEGG